MFLCKLKTLRDLYCFFIYLALVLLMGYHNVSAALTYGEHDAYTWRICLISLCDISTLSCKTYKM